MKIRLDQYLVQHGLIQSRERAKAMIMSGVVFVNEQKVDKAGEMIKEDAKVEVRGHDIGYVSRGGLKLEKAMQCFPLTPKGKVCMDIGASTGGFTDCMLQNGAVKVYAVDVGYGQLAWSLRTDERVVNMERTNIRNVTLDQLAEPIEFFSVDVSFISLHHIFPVAQAITTPDAMGVCLVKPQFEAGREKVGKNGVVRDPATHREVLHNVSKGMTTADKNLILSIPEALATTDRVCSSINVGSTKTGLNMDAVELMGRIVTETAQATKDNDSLGCAKLVVFCNAPDDNPFMAGAFHGVTEADAIINVGVSGPGVVKVALEKVRGENFEVLCETIKKTAFKITRVGQLVAQEASKRLGIPFGIIDLSLAPTPAVGDSVAEILEEIGLERVGAPGTTAALAMLNDQVKKGGVMASSYVGGLSGAFIPVSEDQGMIDAVSLGALTIEKLEAMTCVCSVGLDMIAIPGDTPSTTIAGIIADEAAIGMVNQKTTAVRLIPVIGKKVGDTAEFGGLLGYAPIIPVNTFSCEKFVTRGGRIPAPIHSFKN